MGWVERKKERMTRETILYFFVMCTAEVEMQRFFRELFSDSILMRNHSMLLLKAVCAVRRVYFPHLFLLPYVYLIC